MKSIPAGPHVTVNMAMSADGKITTHRRERVALGSAEDRYLMDVLRARADAVIIGAGTLRLDGWAIRVRNTEVRRKRVRQGRPTHPLNVALTSRLDIPPTAQFLTHPHTRKLIITSSLAPRARVRRFEKLAEIVVLPTRRIRPDDVLDALSRRGVRRVLVEGGGQINFSFFEAGLVDEIYITVTPRIIGGADAPTPVDGHGFLVENHIRLDLLSCRKRGDDVFLRYRIRGRR